MIPPRNNEKLYFLLHSIIIDTDFILSHKLWSGTVKIIKKSIQSQAGKANTVGVRGVRKALSGSI